jgi:hypothetical protein
MKRFVRLLLFPLALVLFVIGFVVGELLIFGIIGIALLVFTSFFYSHRKQRVRYWIQGYKTHLENNENNKIDAIKSIQQEFCASKYADNDFCNNEYQNIDTLVEDIIKREFKFEKLVQSPISTPNDIQGNISAYVKAKEKVKHEITDVKKEILS